MAQTQERGGHAADSPWSLPYEQLILSQLHDYRMYLEVATYTTQDARKAGSLAHAERIHKRLNDLSGQLALLPAARSACIKAQLTGLIRAALLCVTRPCWKPCR